MSATGTRTEAAVLQAVLPQLEAQGFRVSPHPSRTILPAFLQGYHPDAIALKGDKKIAIQVVPSAGPLEPRLERLRQALLEHGDWEFRIVYAPPLGSEADIAVQSRTAIEDQLARITKTFDEAGPAMSLLAGWAALEAAARLLMPDALGGPQTPARLLEALAFDGYVTPEEADLLRRLGRLRNAAAHGGLDVAVTSGEIDGLVGITRTLLGLGDQSLIEPTSGSHHQRLHRPGDPYRTGQTV
jgi:hypothetical protein